jgi:hypothetical protein
MMNLWSFENETLGQMLRDAEHVHDAKIATDAVRKAVFPTIVAIRNELEQRGPMAQNEAKIN